jgi:hypothetical protein
MLFRLKTDQMLFENVNVNDCMTSDRIEWKKRIYVTDPD